MASVLPITVIVLLLSITVAPLDTGAMTLFLFGAVMLIFGMGLFTLGVDMSMLPMGEGIGFELSRSKRILLPVLVFFLLGALSTIAEPDLQVLANQVPSIDGRILIYTVAAGVGVFLVVAALRIYLQIPLRRLLIFFYLIVFSLTIFVPPDFIPVSFDSGGVTTGPITVPFIMALGLGIASSRSDENSSSDSFGLVALCSIGPILAVLLLGAFYQPEQTQYLADPIPTIITTAEAARHFLHAFPTYFHEVAVALVPIAALFILFQLLTHRYLATELWRILAGFVYTYLGLVLFLCGVSEGFMSAGSLLAATLVREQNPYLLIPVGMLIGYFIVRAEPAVAVLNKQVEEVSNGSISQKSMGTALSLGVCVSVGLAMLRVVTGLNILWLLIPGYAFALVLTFFVPPIYTGIAFDSGGVASGPMTATFLLPFAIGSSSALGGDIMADAFGIVAMVAMTPLVTIQGLGLFSEMKHKVASRRLIYHMERVDDDIVYFD